MAPKLHFRLQGRFRVTDAEGNDRTPKSAKGQGILALLLTSPDHERGRLWLQDKLWSERPPKQGADSFRQALRDIRSAFSDQSDALKSDRRTVQLDPASVTIVDSPELRDAEFLEGLDIRDPEFNLWLSGQRAQMPEPSETNYQAPPRIAAPQARVQILFLNETEQSGKLKFIENQFIDSVSRSVREELNVEILRRLPATAQPGILVASVQAFEDQDNRVGLRASIEDIDANSVLWSQMEVVQSRGAPATSEMRILALGHRMATNLKWAATQGAGRQAHSTDANLLALMAVRKMFTLQHDQLEEAEGMLKAAFEAEKRGVYQSWLAQLYSIQLIERAQSIDEIGDKSDAACALALELEPENSNVLASVADASLVVRRNFLRSAELAKMSVQANAANPLAWWTMASGHMYLDNKDEAYRAALNAQALAGSTRLRFWTDIQAGLTALVKGKTVQGLRNLETSSALSPDFRAPLRYRTAIYSAAGMTDAAHNSAQALTRLENDFSFERLANDPDYPVSLMRKHGMLDKITFPEE